MVTSRNIRLILLLLCSSAALLAQSKSEQGVLTTETVRFEAMMRFDTAALRPMLAEDLLYIHSNALEEDKTAHLNAISSRKIVYADMQREQSKVYLYGKTALVTGILHVGGTYKDTPFDVRLRYTAVYRKKRGKWLLLHWQSTKLPE